MSSRGWVVASSPWRRGRHRPGGAQECTQIGKNGLSVPFRGICVHCCAVGLGCGWPWDHNSVHKWEDRASPHRIGPFVYTVAPLRTDVGTQECTQIGKNGPSAPFWAICVHCCDARCDASCDARSGKVPCTASLCRPETFSIPDEWEASHGRQFEKLYSQTSLPDSLQSIDASVELAHRLLGPVLAGLAGGVTWSLHEAAWEDQICYGKRRRIPRIRPRPAAGRPRNRPS